MNDRIPLIMRGMDGMQIENNHWTYSGLRQDGTRVGIWGGDALYPKCKTADLKAELAIEDGLFFRDEKRFARNQALLARIAEYVTEHGREP